MAERAKVTSTEALEQFRNQLIIYISKARPALEEVTADVLRARSWLENDQRILWENQIRRQSYGQRINQPSDKCNEKKV